ncbi:MAG: PIN domain-containing protein [Candidatus Omnitrophica bacterium]|nr:PIN domain-containing protein [Candidatus Omnitrophota bacterium]
MSGLLTPHGTSARLVDLAQREELRLLYDDRILHEYDQVLRRPRFGFSATTVALLLEFVEMSGERVVARPLPPAGTDLSDQPFLEVAVSGVAELLVTGNRRHYPRHPVGSLRILNSAEALRWMLSRDEFR